MKFIDIKTISNLKYIYYRILKIICTLICGFANQETQILKYRAWAQGHAGTPISEKLRIHRTVFFVRFPLGLLHFSDFPLKTSVRLQKEFIHVNKTETNTAAPFFSPALIQLPRFRRLLILHTQGIINYY